jgi:hypothetical protein
MLFHMEEDPDSDRFERLRTKGRTIISKKTLKAIDAQFNGGLTAWKTRHAPALATHPTNETHFNIAVTQLFETYQKSNDPDALRFLDKLVQCASNNQCRQVFCPACRTRMQTKKAATALKQFSTIAEGEIFMMTLLIEVVQNASDVSSVVKRVRKEL